MKVTGKTLIDMGYRPAPWFGDAIAKLNEDDLDSRKVFEEAKRFHNKWQRERIEKVEAAMAPVGVVTEYHPENFLNIEIRGEHDQATIEQLRNCMKYGDVECGVLCADGHLGYAQPVGGVIAYRDQVSVSGVGFDIGCGNLAQRTDLMYSDFTLEELNNLADKIGDNISFGVGRTNNSKVEAECLDDLDAWKAGDVEQFRDLAASQLGTVGGGNHYVNVMVDNEDFLWVAVHFGSRGFGHKTAKMYLERAGGKDGIHAAPTVLDVHSDIGTQYLHAMQLAGRYAGAGRRHVVAEVMKLMGAGYRRESVHNHHNYAWYEEHRGEYFWVVRKGATPAFPEQQGFVGSSMGGDAFIVEGIDSREARDMLYSTVHGSGRLYSRKFAKQTISREEMDATMAASGVILRGGDVDESPMVYRNLGNVLAAQNALGPTVKVVRQLKPVIVVMAGASVKDPYKD